MGRSFQILCDYCGPAIKNKDHGKIVLYFKMLGNYEVDTHSNLYSGHENTYICEVTRKKNIILDNYV